MKRHAVVLFVGLILAFSSGCQTWVREAGITVPSPQYLKHFPNYFPPSPPYPLPKELNSSEEASKAYFDNPRQ